MEHRPNATQGAVLSASSLKGSKVVNAAGEDLGAIEDIMLHTDTGDAAYAVLSFGGFMGLGNKLFAVPWKALRVDMENSGIVLDVPRERLEDAPSIDKDDWPLTPDASWMEEIHRHYGLEYGRRRP